MVESGSSFGRSASTYCGQAAAIFDVVFEGQMVCVAILISQIGQERWAPVSGTCATFRHKHISCPRGSKAAVGGNMQID